MAKKNRAIAIIKNATSNYVRQILQIAIFVALTPFIVSKVGADDFGLWSLIQATIGLLGLMDMGFATSVVKYIAEARGKGDESRVAQLTSTFFWQYSILGLLMLIVTVALVPALPSLFGIPESKARTGQIVFLLIGLRAAQALPMGLFAGILVGYQKQLLSNISRVLGTLSYGLLAWWALTVSPTIETLAWVSLGTGFAANFLSFIMCMKAAKGVSLHPRNFRRSMLGEIGSFSLWFFLIQISMMIATRVDTIIINAFMPLAAVAIYTVAIRISEKSSQLCAQFTNTLTPVIAELKGAGEESNIRAVFLKGSMLAVAAAVPLLLGLAWLAEDLSVTWMGEEFRDAALPCRILLGAAFIGILHGNTSNVLSMTGHQKYLAISTLGGQILNLVLTLILVRSWGLTGVALATLVSQAIVQIFFIQVRGGKSYQITPSEYYSRTLLPSLPGAVACILSIWLFSQVLPPDTLIHVAILIAIGGIFFIPAFWYIGLRAPDREYLGGRLRKLARKGSAKQAEPKEVV